MKINIGDKFKFMGCTYELTKIIPARKWWQLFSLQPKKTIYHLINLDKPGVFAMIHKEDIVGTQVVSMK